MPSFSIFTLFPDFFDSPFRTSLLHRARSNGVIQLDTVNIRSFGEGPHHIVDDRPFGGGSGMVFKAPVLEKALAVHLQAVGVGLEELAQDVQCYRQRDEHHSKIPYILSLSPQGNPWSAQSARKWAEKSQLSPIFFICGHYEGIDERFTERYVHEEISIGDYILTGGEPAVLVVLDSLLRFVPGVVGDPASVSDDTFELQSSMGIPNGLKAPMYTRPVEWNSMKVPSVLLSGHHQAIESWRKKTSYSRTLKRRPELLLKSMNPSTFKRPIDVVLMHHPMVDREGKEVTTAVTNLDLHDIARSCCTYGIRNYYVVNPKPEQKRIVEAILGHWHQEVSQNYHPARAQALKKIVFRSTFEEVYNDLGAKPKVFMPDARDLSNYFSPERIWSYEKLRFALESGIVSEDELDLTDESRKAPILLIFGTGWGVSSSFFPQVDFILKPLKSADQKNYNHLSVRAAVGIILDRLLGNRELTLSNKTTCYL